MTPVKVDVMAVPDVGFWPHTEVRVGEACGAVVSDPTGHTSAAEVMMADDLAREVYCILGMPIDAVDMAEILWRIDAAAESAEPFFISTPNINFLVMSLRDKQFREALLASDLCPVDGMPIVWIAILMGLPIRARLSGADILDAIRERRGPARPMNVYLFGGANGVVAAAANSLNARPCGWNCVGSMYPGFGTVDELSSNEVIAEINRSNADFLAIALGANKGQAWLYNNYDRLRIPIRVHLGAAIDFQAGRLKRAPRLLRKYGFEWLWRIKEDPQLWRRYCGDGLVLLRLLVTRVLPLVILGWWQRFRSKFKPQNLTIETSRSDDGVVLRLGGIGTEKHIGQAIAGFAAAVADKPKIVTIDLSRLHAVDARFLGLLLMLRKRLKGQGGRLAFIGLSRRLTTLFRLNGVEFLLASQQSV